MITAPEVVEVKSGDFMIGYMVRSKSVPGAWRYVRGNECSCPAGTKRTCRHRQLVAAHCRDIDAQHARPAGAVRASMFVD